MKFHAGGNRLAMALFTVVLTASCRSTPDQKPYPSETASSKGPHLGSVTIGVYRPSLSAFLLRNSNTNGNPDISVTFGLEGDIPLAGDWDGNGSVTIGVYRPSSSLFFLR